jgi:hypothetical protein
MKWTLVAIASLLFAIPATAQKHPDPLNQLEIDQLRDTAQDPLERLKLYVGFARARLQALDQARSDPKVADRGAETHDRLQDFLDIFDELNDNVDTFADRKEDLRKALKVVIEGDSEFQSKLRALKDAAGVRPAELKAYGFLLTNAIETVDSSIEDHRQLLDAQVEAAKQKKKK